MSQLILENIKFVFNFIYENKYMSDMSYIELNEIISGGMNQHDISEVISLVYKISLIMEVQVNQTNINGNVRTFTSNNNRGKIESIFFSYKELDGLTDNYKFIEMFGPTPLKKLQMGGIF